MACSVRIVRKRCLPGRDAAVTGPVTLADTCALARVPSCTLSLHMLPLPARGRGDIRPRIATGVMLISAVRFVRYRWSHSLVRAQGRRGCGADARGTVLEGFEERTGQAQRGRSKGRGGSGQGGGGQGSRHGRCVSGSPAKKRAVLQPFCVWRQLGARCSYADHGSPVSPRQFCLVLESILGMEHSPCNVSVYVENVG